MTAQTDHECDYYRAPGGVCAYCDTDDTGAPVARWCWLCASYGPDHECPCDYSRAGL